jgi:hypothetical protein
LQLRIPAYGVCRLGLSLSFTEMRSLVCNPFNPQLLISHLTNSNGCGNVAIKVLLTVSPFRPFLLPSPTPCVFAAIQFLSTLCFHHLTNPSSCNSLLFTSIQNPRGVTPPSINAVVAAVPFFANPFVSYHILQALYFHAIPHSFTQRRSAIPSILKSFSTLSIATGVYYPLSHPCKAPSRE